MPKTKKRSYASAKKPARKKQRVGYTTVARTRGAYATGEMKYFDTGLSATAIPASSNWTSTVLDPTALCLCAPTQGAGINQRIGKAVVLHKLKIRGRVITPPVEAVATATASVYIRFIICQDKQTNATQMTGTQLMGTFGGGLHPFCYQNIDNFGRFTVLKDKVYVVEDPNLSGDAAAHDVNSKSRVFKFTLKFRKGVPIRFNATNGGTVADIVDNSFHILANASVAGSSIEYVCRACYKE